MLIPITHQRTRPYLNAILPYWRNCPRTVQSPPRNEERSDRKLVSCAQYVPMTLVTTERELTTKLVALTTCENAVPKMLVIQTKKLDRADDILDPMGPTPRKLPIVSRATLKARKTMLKKVAIAARM